MKLYYSPGACSLAPHLVLEELGLQYEGVPVDLKTHTYSGGDYREVNPKGSVPALELDNGEVLTENAVILQYLADQKPDSKMMPKQGTLERYRALEWLNYIATELHKSFAPFFRSDTPESYKKISLENITKKFDYVSERLSSRPFLMGTQYTVPDAYLFVMLTWAPNEGFKLESWPNLLQFFRRMNDLPSTKRTLEEEGLQKSA